MWPNHTWLDITEPVIAHHQGPTKDVQASSLDLLVQEKCALEENPRNPTHIKGGFWDSIQDAFFFFFTFKPVCKVWDISRVLLDNFEDRLQPRLNHRYIISPILSYPLVQGTISHHTYLLRVPIESMKDSSRHSSSPSFGLETNKTSH